MKTKLNEIRPAETPDIAAMPEPPPQRADSSGEEIDLSLLEDSLSKTPWERMQANDDALRFADSLRAAMEKRYAKPERTDPQTC